LEYTYYNLPSTSSFGRIPLISKITEFSLFNSAKSKSENIPTGVYHCTDLGQTNWYEFAKEIHHFGIKYGKITGNCVVNPCTTEEYPVKAKRPAYSVLNKDKLMKNLNITLPEWKQNLEEFIKNIQ
jgi:dTDP-4-dehydrorhamnose reductase